MKNTVTNVLWSLKSRTIDDYDFSVYKFQQVRERVAKISNEISEVFKRKVCVWFF